MKLLPSANVVKSQGVTLSGDVFKIWDVAPVQRRKPKQAEAVQEPLLDDDGQLLEQESYEEILESEPEAEYAPSPIHAEIIQGAMVEASRILEEAVKAAEASKAEILARARFEAEKQQKEILENAKRQGFASVVGDMQQTANLLQDVIARMEGDKAGFEAEYEQNLKWFSVEIASKVLAKKVSQDDAELLEMVCKTAKSVQNEPWVRIEVAMEMTSLIEKLMEVYDENTKVEVLAAPLSPGSIQIETPAGVIDASLRTQLNNLKAYFEQSQSEHSKHG